jgi:hypothetical protein
VKTTGTTSRKEQAATNSSSRVQTNLSPQAIQKRPVHQSRVFFLQAQKKWTKTQFFYPKFLIFSESNRLRTQINKGIFREQIL